MKRRLHRTSVLLFSIGVLGLSSCSDEPSDGTSLEVSTTPYVLDLKGSISAPRLPSDNPLTEEGVQLGRMLFYDPILSADSSQSCAGCHNQAFAFTDNEKALSTGIRGLKGHKKQHAYFQFGLA